jgi:hypothetical protein
MIVCFHICVYTVQKSYWSLQHVTSRCILYTVHKFITFVNLCFKTTSNPARSVLITVCPGCVDREHTPPLSLLPALGLWGISGQDPPRNCGIGTNKTFALPKQLPALNVHAKVQPWRRASSRGNPPLCRHNRIRIKPGVYRPCKLFVLPSINGHMN